MIFYTLQGPTSKLEIYADKMRLVKKNWAYLLSRKVEIDTWNINELSQFEITVPKFLFFSGKIEWNTFNGEKGMFRFSTNAQMMKKIEIYLQKRVLKNLQNQEKNKGHSSPRAMESSLKAA